MIGDFVVALIGVVGGLVLLTVLVAVLVRPPVRRFGRAVATFRAEVAQRTVAMRAMVLARRTRG